MESSQFPEPRGSGNGVVGTCRELYATVAIEVITSGGEALVALILIFLRSHLSERSGKVQQCLVVLRTGRRNFKPKIPSVNEDNALREF